MSMSANLLLNRLVIKLTKFQFKNQKKQRVLNSLTTLKQVVIVFAMLAINFFSIKVFAWGDLGHETVAAIAEKILADDVATKKAINAIIGIEPLPVSSTWPDKVRSDERFRSFAPYHYITIYEDKMRVDEKSAMTILQKYPNTLNDKNMPREAKMLALRYLVHVVGDIHQPHHVGNEFDRGANTCQIDWQTDSSRSPFRTNLHSAWDTLIVNDVSDLFRDQAEPKPNYWGYKEFTDALILKYKDMIKENVTVDVKVWVDESSQLNKTVAYPDQLGPSVRPYCKAKKSDIKAEDVPLLGRSYLMQHKDLIEKRIVLAGMRLAALLKKTFANSKLRKPVAEEILKIIQFTKDTQDIHDHDHADDSGNNLHIR